MQVLHLRSTSKLDGQSGQLLGYLDQLFQRLVLPRKQVEPLLVSREEIRAMVFLRTHGRAIMTDFADALGVPLSTATHAVDRLVKKGLVVRTRSEQDRRIVEVDMSERGKKLQAELRAGHQALARRWLEPLTPAEREMFLGLMSKIALRAKPEQETKESGE